MRRMDRYLEEESKDKITRSSKNQDLYENIGKNTRYTSFIDVANMNVDGEINLDNKTKEKNKQYSNLIPGPKVKRELEEFKSIYKVKENRVYDINSVMAEARKNRKETDEKEAKRKLKNDTYNILINLSKEELEEYRNKRKERFTHPDEEELHELIDTITSKVVAGEMEKSTSVNLLSELMATSLLEKIKKEELQQQKEEDTFYQTTDIKTIYKQKGKESEESTNKIDNSSDEKLENTSTNEENQEQIFTEEIVDEITEEEEEKEKTSNLSTDTEEEQTSNLNMDTEQEDIKPLEEEEMDEEFKEKTLPLPIKILFFLIFVGIIATAVYFVWKMN